MIIIYTLSHAPLLLLFFYYIYHHYYSKVVETEAIIDPMVEYINKNKNAFLKTYEKDKNMSENIEPIFYNKKDYTAFMKTDKNEIEVAWKTRILHENTPKGPIVMFYDAYKQAFTYYTDQTSMPITVLNAVAMKYVTRFMCRDFYYDEQTLKIKKIEKDEKEKTKTDKKEKEKEDEEEEEEEEFILNTYLSPLIKIHNEKEETDETKKLKNLLNTAPFARLKSNKTVNNNDKSNNDKSNNDKSNNDKSNNDKSNNDKSNNDKSNNDKNNNDKKKKNTKEINVNKFVSLGKMYNFNILQKKTPQTDRNKNTNYDDMFNTSKARIISTKMSYKDFKQSKQD